MRTIKFRGKRKSDSTWVHGYFGKDYSERCIICNYLNAPNEAWEVVPETVSQSTGHLDEENTEIYEGDIVRCIDMMGEEYISKIECRDGAFIVDVNSCDYDFSAIGWAIDTDIEEIYVIGNIFDNPELLKGGIK